ncbi:MAG: glycosyltransferase family 39 protein, partial [Aggregatilineales bacterium]
ANIGRTILEGGTPFVDMWDIKPPPIYYIYAAGMALFGETTAGIRAIDFVAVPIGMLGLFLFGQLLSGRKTALWASLIYGVFYFTESFASLTQNDTLVTIPMIWAAYFSLRSTSYDKNSPAAIQDALITGLLCGVILWFKHYNAFFVLAMVLYQLFARRSFAIREAIGFVIGGLITGGSLLLFFASQGMVQEMLIIAEGTSAYNAQGYQFERFLGAMGNYLAFRWQHWGVMVMLVALWLPLIITGRPRSSIHPINNDVRTQHAASLQWWLVVLWLMAGIAFVMIQSLGFDTHWIPMLPPLALIAGDSLARLLAYMPQKTLKSALMGVCIIGFLSIIAFSTWRRALPYYLGQETQTEFFARFQGNDFKPEESLQVVEYLQERIAPGDTIYVW